MFKSHKEFQYK